MTKPRLALARADEDRTPCALCGHHRTGIELGRLPVAFICLVCVAALGRWLPTITEELAGQIWRFQSGQVPATEVQDEQPGPTQSDHASAEAIFHEFKAGLQKVVRPDDAETHLDLGIAYREMGLGRDAIAEWGVVLSSNAGVRALRRAALLIFDPSFLTDEGFELIRTNLYPT